MGIRSWLTSCKRLILSATKPGKTEFWLLFRVCLIGVVILGVIGFLIRFVFAMIGLTKGG